MHSNIQNMGGKVLGCYAVMGEYDFVGICELPGDEAAVGLMLGLGAGGDASIG